MNAQVWGLRGTLILLLVSLAGCATSSYVQDVPAERANFEPKPGQALIVFMRPSSFGGAVQSSVFRLAEGTQDFVAVVSAKTKVAYDLAPGTHDFMVVGESADFMRATVEAGKTYHALVTPRVGFWKARFSLRPVAASDRASGDFDKWFAECRWVENKLEAHQWAQGNMANVASKRAEYWPKWDTKPDKPLLVPTDGM